MNYQLQFRKFITSQYLYTGLRTTAGVIIPAVILYQYGLLTSMISLPLGALFVSLTDNPGPINYRKWGMLVTIVLNVMMVLFAGYSHVFPGIVIIQLIVFGFIFSMIAVFGQRANSIGLIALIVYIINLGNSTSTEVWREALYFTAGGIWYAILSLSLYTLRPYKAIQQLLGESLMEIAGYLQTRRLFYEKERNLTQIYQQLMQFQVKIHNHQNEMRDMLFTARQALSESTVKGRVLMMMFLDSIDLMERIMTTQQDYEQLHKEFDDTGILENMNDSIRVIGNILRDIGLAVQAGYSYKADTDLDAAVQDAMNAFIKLRQEKLSAENVEGFIRLRQILYSLQDIASRVKRLGQYTSFDKKISRQYKTEVELDQFVSPQEINFQLFMSNITLKSSVFRHSVRLTIALVFGYLVSLILPLGHGYWILLTIAVIMKPAYSITRQRNIQRLVGTLIGGFIGFGLLYLTSNNGVIFTVMLLSMVIAYSMLKLQYAISSAGLTIFILLMFYFLDPVGLQTVLTERVVDTVIGSVIAYLASTFILPAWEHRQMDELVTAAIEGNEKYFEKVANTFQGVEIDQTEYKIARRDAFVTLANLSDNFQRMLSEPKNRQPNLKEYHQFVAATHMFTSHIASLGYYANRFGTQYNLEDFKPMISQINRMFKKILSIMKSQTPVELETTSFPMNKKVQQLLEQRKKDLAGGIDSDMDTIRKKLSDLKTITEQFQLIYGNLVEQFKICSSLKKIKQPALQKVEQN